jgi:hypothetical protein
MKMNIRIALICLFVLITNIFSVKIKNKKLTLAQNLSSLKEMTLNYHPGKI